MSLLHSFPDVTVIRLSSGNRRTAPRPLTPIPTATLSSQKMDKEWPIVIPSNQHIRLGEPTAKERARFQCVSMRLGPYQSDETRPFKVWSEESRAFDTQWLSSLIWRGCYEGYSSLDEYLRHVYQSS